MRLITHLISIISLLFINIYLKNIKKIDNLLAKHSRNPEANRVKISSLFIKALNPENSSLSHQFNLLIQGSQINVIGQKQRLLAVLESNIPDYMKSKYINLICDDIIQTKIKCEEAYYHILKNRYNFVSKMDEELCKIDPAVHGIYKGVKVENVSEKIITSTKPI